jgi:hypothetical protein
VKRGAVAKNFSEKSHTPPHQTKAAYQTRNTISATARSAAKDWRIKRLSRNQSASDKPVKPDSPKYNPHFSSRLSPCQQCLPLPDPRTSYHDMGDRLVNFERAWVISTPSQQMCIGAPSSASPLGNAKQNCDFTACLGSQIHRHIALRAGAASEDIALGDLIIRDAAIMNHRHLTRQFLDLAGATKAEIAS